MSKISRIMILASSRQLCTHGASRHCITSLLLLLQWPCYRIHNKSLKKKKTWWAVETILTKIVALFHQMHLFSGNNQKYNTGILLPIANIKPYHFSRTFCKISCILHFPFEKNVNTSSRWYCWISKLVSYIKGYLYALC